MPGGDRPDKKLFQCRRYPARLSAQPDLRQAFEQAIQQVQSNAAQSLQAILNELSRPARFGDMPRRIELCRQALDLAERETQPELWSWLQNELANSLAQTPLGERAENLEQAIRHYEWALEAPHPPGLPRAVGWDTQQPGECLPGAHSWGAGREPGQAIQHYEQALAVRHPGGIPTGLGDDPEQLRACLLERIRGERAENLEQAIGHYQQALEVYTRAGLPRAVGWDRTPGLPTQTHPRRAGDNWSRPSSTMSRPLAVRTRRPFPGLGA